jgi:hypothetical protein
MGASVFWYFFNLEERGNGANGYMNTLLSRSCQPAVLEVFIYDCGCKNRTLEIKVGSLGE